MRKTRTKVTPEDILAGKRLKGIRERKNTSRKELARHLNVSYQQVQKYEAGTNKIPSQSLYKISQFFNIPMEFFFEKACALNDNALSTRAMLNLGSHEFVHIEESFNTQFEKHKEWIFDAIETGIKYKYNQAYANSHYMANKRISTKRIIKMGEKIIRRLSKELNDNSKQ